MFGDLLGNMQQQQAALQEKLAGILVEAEAGDGAISVQAGADLHVENIRIDPAKLDLSDREQVEDLLLVAVNRALDAARERAAQETNRLLREMLPFDLPGGFPQP